MHSAVTVSLVPQARGGPFVYWDNLELACESAAELGFDAIELFSPAADAVDHKVLASLLDRHGLKLAAVGTGAGWVIHKQHLVTAESEDRAKARQFIRSIIELGAEFGAPAIIGSMQGRTSQQVNRAAAHQYLAEALDDLGQHAAARQVPLLIEPLNRYESDVLNTLTDGTTLIESLATDNVKLLADLFHMNIEESEMATALRVAGKHVGHIHFVDTNRRAAGFGHMQYEPIVAALMEIEYNGYLSAEALPQPDPQTAASQTIGRFRELV